MIRVQYTTQAEEDILEIACYIAQDNVGSGPPVDGENPAGL